MYCRTKQLTDGAFHHPEDCKPCPIDTHIVLVNVLGDLGYANGSYNDANCASSKEAHNT